MTVPHYAPSPVPAANLTSFLGGELKRIANSFAKLANLELESLTVSGDVEIGGNVLFVDEATFDDGIVVNEDAGTVPIFHTMTDGLYIEGERLVLYSGADAIKALRIYNAGGGFKIVNNPASNSNRVDVFQTDNAGATEDAWMTFDRNGGVSLFFDNAVKLRSITNGAEVTTASGNTLLLVQANAGTAASVICANTVGRVSSRASAAAAWIVEQQSAAGSFEANWVIGTRGAGLEFHYNNVVALKTVDRSATGVLTGAQVQDKSGTLQPVGLGVKVPTTTTANTTLTSAHAGTRVHMGTTPHALTTPASSDTDWPIGALVDISVGTAAPASTIVAGSGVSLTWFTGATTTIATPRTLAAGAMVRLYRRTSTAWDLYGIGIT